MCSMARREVDSGRAKQSSLLRQAASSAPPARTPHVDIPERRLHLDHQRSTTLRCGSVFTSKERPVNSMLVVHTAASWQHGSQESCPNFSATKIYREEYADEQKKYLTIRRTEALSHAPQPRTLAIITTQTRLSGITHCRSVPELGTVSSTPAVHPAAQKHNRPLESW